MKKIFHFIVAALILVSGCKRNEPQSAEVPVSPDSSLLPLVAYNLPVSEPSGLSYCAATNTLYMVSDAHPEIFEMSLDGKILRTISAVGSDFEGICLSKNNDTIFVVEEANYMVAKFLQNGQRVGSFKAVLSSDIKHALEGITIDNNYNIYLLNEKFPCYLAQYSYSGSENWKKEISYTTDVSEVLYDAKTDCLWVLSDESQALLKLTKEGALLNRWSLPIVQPEGLAMTNDKIYIVSDTEAKLYVFNRP